MLFCSDNFAEQIFFVIYLVLLLFLVRSVAVPYPFSFHIYLMTNEVKSS